MGGLSIPLSIGGTSWASTVFLVHTLKIDIRSGVCVSNLSISIGGTSWGSTVFLIRTLKITQI